MSSGQVRRVSHQDIQLVRNLIERCLQLYMNQKEVVDTLLMQAKIEPDFTELVWQELEEENRDFFKAYHVRLILKNQIMVFNRLLEKQAELMHKLCQPALSSVHPSNGSRPAAGVDGSDVLQFSNNAPLSAGGLNMPTSLPLMQNSTLGMLQGINGAVIKAELNYSDNLEYPFYPDGTLSETPSSREDTSAAPFSSSDLAGPQFSEPLRDLDTTPFGFLSQLPRNFSFSDLTDDFTHG